MKYSPDEKKATKSKLEVNLNKAFKKRLKEVKSGIAFDQLAVKLSDGSEPPVSLAASFVKSRAARVLLAGAGFLADAYDLFVINLVLRLLRDEYPEYVASGRLLALEGAVASAALFGSVLGQVVAGTLADMIGRKKIFIATAILIAIGSFGSACSLDTPMLTVYGQIACWRFFLGAGVGGEYPLAATVTSESSSAARRGSLMAAVFAMQGVGSLLSVLVVICCLSLNASASFTWRFSLAFGALPVLIAFPWRLRMHETETFERVQQNRRDLTGFVSYGSLSAVGASRDNSLTSHHNTSSMNTNSLINNNPINATTNNNTAAVSALDKAASAGYHIGDESMKGLSPYNSYMRQYGGTDNTNNETTSLLNNNHNSNNNNNNNHHHLSSVPSQAPSTDIHHKPISFSRYAEIERAWLFYKWHIFGTAICWFLLDIVFYANGLFNHDVTSIILSSGKHTTALQDAQNSFLLCLMGIPGYWLSVFYMERVGRKNIQFNGFIMMGLLFTTCAIFHDWFLETDSPPYRKWLFLLLYSLTFLFSNFGPNTTTFIIPGEIYPPEVKATCHGLSAASGKLGAAAGAYLFPLILNNANSAATANNTASNGSSTHSSVGLRLCLLICAIVALIGAIMTYFFIPTYGARDLEDPDTYLALDHDFVRPSDDTIIYMRQTIQAKAAPYTMIEIIDHTDNYGLQQIDGKSNSHNNSQVKVHTSGKISGKNTDRV